MGRLCACGAPAALCAVRSTRPLGVSVFHGLTAVFLVLAFALAGCAKTNDADVIRTVLAHFSARADISSVYPNGVTFVARETGTWSLDRFRVFTLNRQRDACQIAPELYERFFERNASQGSAAELIVPDRKWRLETPQEWLFVKPRVFVPSRSGEKDRPETTRKLSANGPPCATDVSVSTEYW